MKVRATAWLASATLAVFVVCTAPASAGDALETVKPPEAGFSAERLARVDAAMRHLVDEGELAGIVTMMARHGKVVHQKAFGAKNLEAGAPMTTDAIFRIYSMTKPVIGVAMMILYEEGKWKLDDPIHKYIPEFNDLKVFAGAGEDGDPILEDPAHAPTMRELMTHTAGFAYGEIGNTPVDRMYRDVDVLDPQSSLPDMIDKLAGLPLLYQPGTRWVYSLSVDIQGYLVEKLSGRSLPDFLRERIFEPLDMRDTGFYVPEGKRDRFAALYAFDAEKEALRPTPGDRFGAGNHVSPPGLPSGGAGLVSTARDYMRLCQMLLNGGRLGDARILAPASVEMMRADHLPKGLSIQPGIRFGLDFALTMDPARAGTLTGEGTYYWAGAAGTWFWIDPEHDLAFVGMIQRMNAGAPGSPVDMRHVSTTAVYQALVDPGK